ncbi:unnamed protein product [Cunninghamella blakesleeana]
MTHYEALSSEKLPSISMISPQQEENIKLEMTEQHHYSEELQYNQFLSPTQSHFNHEMQTSNYGEHVYTHQQQHLSPPLTPAISPSPSSTTMMMMDPMQFKRKYSVDVGPFGFNAHPSLMHDQDAYRRSSCSAMSADDCLQQQNVTQPSYHHPYMATISSPLSSSPTTMNEMNTSPMMHHHQPYPTPTSIIHPNHNNDEFNQGQQNSSKSMNGLKRRSHPSLSNHAQQQGPNTQHKHVCKYSYCGWSFKRYEHLKRHMLVHTGERPHTCPFPGCGKSFSRSDNFHAHYRTHTKKANNPPPHSSTRRSSKKGNSSTTTMMNNDTNSNNTTTTMSTSLTMSVSPSSSSTCSSSSISSPLNQDLSNGFNHTQPPTPSTFIFNPNQKQFDIPYPDIYDQRTFSSSNEVQGQYTLNNSQPYNGNDVSSLLNHDQVSTSPLFNNAMTSPYDLHHQDLHYSSSSSSSSSPLSASMTIHGGYLPNHPHQHHPLMNPLSVSMEDLHQQQQPMVNSNNNKKRKNSQLDDGNNNDLQQKSHVCPMIQCQRRFKRLEHMKRHMRIHTMERPFACTYPKCHKRFSRSDNLSQHMKTHQRTTQDRRRRSSAIHPTTTSNNNTANTSMNNNTINTQSTMINQFQSPPLTHYSLPPADIYTDASSLPWSSAPESISC